MKDNSWLWVLGGLVALLALGGTGVAVSDYIISERGKQYLPTIQAAATQYNVPWQLLAAQLKQESGYDPNAVSGAGAQGIAQFMPATAQQYGLTDPFDPIASIYAQAHLMSDLYTQFGDWGTALAGYNWGAGNVQNAMNSYGTGWLAQAPAETQNYVTTITGNAGISTAIA